MIVALSETNLNDIYLESQFLVRKNYMKKFIFLSSLFLAFLIFFTSQPIEAFHAEVSPNEIEPGEAFFIRLTDAKTEQLPTASLIKKRFHFSRCEENCFISIGTVGIETKPGIYPIKLKVGKKKKSISIVVKDTSFSTIELTLPEDQVILSPENLRRVKKENRRVKSICKAVSKRLWEGSFILPLENGISSTYGTRRIFNNKHISVHRGIDIAGEEGDKVMASNKGRVIFTEELFLGGNTIILDHGQGIYTIYMHLSKFNSKPLDIVSKGDTIGFLGSTGRSTDPHLHFGVKVMNINTNPVSLVELDL